MKSYILTVVVPIYNTDKYLEETLYCIEEQSIGFSNMEIILVNDGSTDSSATICCEFQRRHKKNVCYVEIPINRGVGHARNKGLNLANGKYITFWDSDDLWSKNAMEKAVNFLEAHEEEIDMVSANIQYFSGSTKQHILNFKLDKSQIIDIKDDYRKLRVAGAACVMRTEAAIQYRVDESQSCWEDAKYMNQLLLRKKKYGMLANVTYYYRYRKTKDSATQTHAKNKQYYLHDIESLYQGIYKESLKQCGEFLPMMQYLSAYVLGYCFAETVTIIEGEEREKYEVILQNIISNIEDLYIKEIPNANFYVKLKMLAFKYGIKIEEELQQWQQENYNTVSHLNRTLANYDILKKWFVLKQQNKKICAYFEKNGYNRIAIYGMSDLGVYLLKELAGSSICIMYGIDRRAKKLKTRIPILTIEDSLPEVDAIIVTAVYFCKEIDELLKDKVTCPVISLEDVLETIEWRNMY